MMAHSIDPLVGSLLGARYLIDQKVGRGGMAGVYRAHDTRLQRTVAVKIMHEGLRDEEDFAAKFRREARAAARLVHPNVVAVFDSGKDNDRPFIVMEYVEGETLRQLLRREGALEPTRALAIMEQVLAALACAHDGHLIHRDVKPENVLIPAKGPIKVADFGLAKAVSGDTVTATQGLLMGTASYIAPEAVAGQRASTASDVYSAGIVLFEMLTGRKPHTGESPIQVVYKHCNEDVGPPSALVDPNTGRRIPAYVDALVRSATQRNPAQRLGNARAFLERLRMALRALEAGVTRDARLVEAMTAPLTEPAELTADAISTQVLAPAVPVGGTAWNPEDTPTEFTPTELTPTEPTPPKPVAPAPRPPLPRTSRRPRRRWGAFASAIIMLLLLSALGYGGWYLLEGQYRSMPAVVGMGQDEAVAALTEQDLTADVTLAYSESVAKGDVIATDPAADERLTVGSRVDVEVSRGPERYAAPTLVGLTLDQATEALTGAHLALGTVDKRYDEKVKAGVVVSTNAKPDAQLKPDTRVDLVLSLGRQPIDVTDHTGSDAAKARQGLEASGFRVTVTEQHSASAPRGRVIAQDPASGTGFRRDTITLTVSKGPVMVVVPNVRNMDTAKAIAELKARGFVTSIKRVNPVPFEKVSYTDPKAGTKLPKGSEVVVYVA